jgi:hypothetical protein
MFRLLSLVTTKSCNKVTRYIVSLVPSIITRSFHINLLYRSNYDFSNPYNYIKYTENVKRPIYKVYEVRFTINQSSE